MEFRKMVMMILYVRQQKRHRCIEQSFGLCGEEEGGMTWENGIETCLYYIIFLYYKKRNHQSSFDAGYRMLGVGALG